MKSILGLICLFLCVSHVPIIHKRRRDPWQMQVLMMVCSCPREIAYTIFYWSPPNLETPLKYFLLDYTPNNVFFVRWHLSNLPPKLIRILFACVWMVMFQSIRIISQRFENKFPAVTITALAQCAGEFKKFSTIHMFRVDNGKTDSNGGNAEMERCAARWYPENMAEVKGALDVSFNGMDEAGACYTQIL